MGVFEHICEILDVWTLFQEVQCPYCLSLMYFFCTSYIQEGQVRLTSGCLDLLRLYLFLLLPLLWVLEWNRYLVLNCFNTMNVVGWFIKKKVLFTVGSNYPLWVNFIDIVRCSEHSPLLITVGSTVSVQWFPSVLDECNQSLSSGSLMIVEFEGGK